jgi:hypothetical protein
MMPKCLTKVFAGVSPEAKEKLKKEMTNKMLHVRTTVILLLVDHITAIIYVTLTTPASIRLLSAIRLLVQ